MAQSGVGVKIRHKSFQLSYVDALPGFCQHTMSLALLLMGAYAAADGWEVALAVDYVHGVAEIAFGQLAYPVGHLIADRTTLLAAWHFAFQTSLCLPDRFRQGIILVDFVNTIFHFSEYVSVLLTKFSCVSCIRNQDCSNLNPKRPKKTPCIEKISSFCPAE